MIKAKEVVVLAVFTALCHSAMASDLPSREMTPGLINPNVNQENIRSTVCAVGFTQKIRPSKNYTKALKIKQIKQYQYSDVDPRHYQEDYLIPLNIGGHPSDPKNLWPQPRGSEWSAEKKDELEIVIGKMVCAGEILLADAQREIAANWIQAYKTYVPTHQHYLFERKRNTHKIAE